MRPMGRASGAVCDLTVRPLEGSPSERLAVLHGLAERGAREVDVRRVAARLSVNASGDVRALAGEVLAFVQRLPYRVDSEGRDDGAAACATLAQGGDCKKLSVLFCALCSACGLTSRLVWIEQPAARLDHVSAQWQHGGRWLWAETTVRGAELGEPPHAAAARLGALREGWL